MIIGGGGREHAIAWKLNQSPRVDEIVCAPGNAGIAAIARCENVSAEEVPALVSLADRERPDLVVVGPEVPLALGITDELQAIGLRVFGPNKKCSQLEASKAFTKNFLHRHGIPTAQSKEYTDIEELKKEVGIFGFPMVLKADGLAAGKGVVIAQNRAEADKAIDEMMGQRVFGEAGDKVVVEEFLRGTEASILCFVDGSKIVPMESAQDYKKIYDEDRGPNTGGMGNYSPSKLYDKPTEDLIRERILAPTYEGFLKDKLDFRGVLFIGIMLTKDGPKVIEFNNRFGDPETQVVLPRLKSDLYDIMVAVTKDRLAQTNIEWEHGRNAVCVVMAAGGYPGSYEKGKEIHGLAEVGITGSGSESSDIIVFHAGTKFGANEEILTNGGRVLGVVGIGSSHERARVKAYEGVRKISFEGAQYRSDIGVVYNTEIEE
jgi:phosphoribosylamine--glycine ligase